jgi:hypothetical protein
VCVYQLISIEFLSNCSSELFVVPEIHDCHETNYITQRFFEQLIVIQLMGK